MLSTAGLPSHNIPIVPAAAPLTLLHQPVLQGISATAVLTLCLLFSSSISGGMKGSLQSPFSPLLLQVNHLLLFGLLSRTLSWPPTTTTSNTKKIIRIWKPDPLATIIMPVCSKIFAIYCTGHCHWTGRVSKFSISSRPSAGKCQILIFLFSLRLVISVVSLTPVSHPACRH